MRESHLSIEKSGNKYELYSRRNKLLHGLKLAIISEVDRSWPILSELIVQSPIMYQILNELLPVLEQANTTEETKKTINEARELIKNIQSKADPTRTSELYG